MTQYLVVPIIGQFMIEVKMFIHYFLQCANNSLVFHFIFFPKRPLIPSVIALLLLFYGLPSWDIALGTHHSGYNPCCLALYYVEPEVPHNFLNETDHILTLFGVYYA